MDKGKTEQLLGGEFCCKCDGGKVSVEVRRGVPEQKIEEIAAALHADKAVLFVSRHFSESERACFETALRAAGAQPVTVSVRRRFDNALENAGALFASAKEAEMIVVCESGLYDAAAYFAALRNIPLVYAAFSPEADGILAPTVSVRIRDKTERICADNPRYIVIDEERLKRANRSEVAAAFASIASGIVSLIDYRVRGALTGEFCRESYNLARGAISEALHIGTDENAPLTLLESRLVIAAVENHTRGLFSGGECAVAELLEGSGKRRLSSAERKFAAAFLLLDLYAAYFSSPHENLLYVPDYAQRAEELSSYIGCGKGTILTHMLSAGAFADEEKIALYLPRLLEEIEILRGWFGSITAKYRDLGGTDLSDQYTFGEWARAIDRAADLPGTFSTLTLMRESGALELLRKELQDRN